MFKGDNEDVAVNFAKEDPYVVNGLISDWNVKKWNVIESSGLVQI